MQPPSVDLGLVEAALRAQLRKALADCTAHKEQLKVYKQKSERLELELSTTREEVNVASDEAARQLQQATEESDSLKTLHQKAVTDGAEIQARQEQQLKAESLQQNHLRRQLSILETKLVKMRASAESAANASVAQQTEFDAFQRAADDREVSAYMKVSKLQGERRKLQQQLAAAHELSQSVAERVSEAERVARGDAEVALAHAVQEASVLADARCAELSSFFEASLRDVEATLRQKPKYEEDNNKFNTKEQVQSVLPNAETTEFQQTRADSDRASNISTVDQDDEFEQFCTPRASGMQLRDELAKVTAECAVLKGELEEQGLGMDLVEQYLEDLEKENAELRVEAQTATDSAERAACDMGELEAAYEAEMASYGERAVAEMAAYEAELSRLNELQAELREQLDTAKYRALPPLLKVADLNDNAGEVECGSPLSDDWGMEEELLSDLLNAELKAEAAEQALAAMTIESDQLRARLSLSDVHAHTAQQRETQTVATVAAEAANLRKLGELERKLAGSEEARAKHKAELKAQEQELLKQAAIQQAVLLEEMKSAALIAWNERQKEQLIVSLHIAAEEAAARAEEIKDAELSAQQASHEAAMEALEADLCEVRSELTSELAQAHAQLLTRSGLDAETGVLQTASCHQRQLTAAPPINAQNLEQMCQLSASQRADSCLQKQLTENEEKSSASQRTESLLRSELAQAAEKCKILRTEHVDQAQAADRRVQQLEGELVSMKGEVIRLMGKASQEMSMLEGVYEALKATKACPAVCLDAPNLSDYDQIAEGDVSALAVVDFI